MGMRTVAVGDDVVAVAVIATAEAVVAGRLRYRRYYYSYDRDSHVAGDGIVAVECRARCLRMTGWRMAVAERDKKADVVFEAGLGLGRSWSSMRTRIGTD